MRRSVVAAFGGVVLSLLMATSVLAFECTNLSKPPAAGTQVVFGPAGEIVWVSRGLERRIEQGLVDPETGDGFTDCSASISTATASWMPAPTSALGRTADPGGGPVRGASLPRHVEFGIFFEQCLT